MSENPSIKETLNVIRKALEDDGPSKTNDLNNILILDKLVKEDGTINIIKEDYLTKKDTINVLHDKLDDVFESHLSKWLDKNVPNYLEKYFKKKII